MPRLAGTNVCSDGTALVGGHGGMCCQPVHGKSHMRRSIGGLLWHDIQTNQQPSSKTPQPLTAEGQLRGIGQVAQQLEGAAAVHVVVGVALQPANRASRMQRTCSARGGGQQL